MAEQKSITVTEILGTDNVGLSRPVINENFKIVKDGINDLYLYLNTAPTGGALTVQTISMPIGSSNITDVNFVSETSAKIVGDLVVNRSLSVTGLAGSPGIADFNVSSNGDVYFNQNNVNFVRNNTTSNTVTYNAHAKFSDGISYDLNSASVNIEDAVSVDPKNYSFDGGATFQALNTLNLSLLAGTPGNDTVGLLAGFTGQVLTIRFADADGSAYKLSGFEGSPGTITLSGTQADFKGSTLTLGYVNSFWVVLNLYGDIVIS